MRRGIVEVAGALQVKDTKTHAERIIALDPGTVALLDQYRVGMESRAHHCDTSLIPASYIAFLSGRDRAAADQLAALLNADHDR